MHATPFKLRHRSASKTAQTLQNFWAQRWTGESANQHQVRFTWDDSSNTIYVQAAPADMKEISELILNMDTSESASVNDVRIRLLRYIPADELSTLLQSAIQQGVIVSAAPGGTGIVGGVTGGAGGIGGGIAGVGGGVGGGIGGGGVGGGFAGAGGAAGGFAGAAGAGGGFAGAGGGFAGAGGAGGLAGGRPAGTTGAITTGTTGTTTKALSLRFLTTEGGRERIVESGLLEDIHFTPILRSNAIMISAPDKTMQLIMAMIDQMAVPASPSQACAHSEWPMKVRNWSNRPICGS